MKRFSKHSILTFFLRDQIGQLDSCQRQEKESSEVNKTAADVISYTQAYSGAMWSCVYFLWALAPIFMNPLINDYGPGTNSALQSDVLTVITHATQYRESMWFRLNDGPLALRMSIEYLLV